ncbi:hypothetical protein [Streptomyces sp. MNP-20]|uniref:hypothetical protein n=1 Tax=Streptomyces sp. MNP-20 TaxID=2721165 RepID=UPI0015532600|nr:hypothetical protein [Streptomyces sp. MNP-20]
MTTSRPSRERVDIDRLTASTITDDQLDAIRAELHRYRNTEPTPPPDATHGAIAPPQRATESVQPQPAEHPTTADGPQ